MSNTITAYFKGRVGVAESVYQYDYGKILIIDGLSLPATFEVHFTTISEDDAVTVIGQNNRVVIPNSCISIPGTVTAYIYLHSGDNDGETEYVIKFAVIRRARPDYDEDEKSNWETAASMALAMLQNSRKVNTPLDEYNQVDNGAAGQLLRTKGDGSTEWVDEGLPTDEQTAQAVSDWLDEHPEATTTVQDGSLTEAKFTNELKLKAIKDYVTPQMFGAKGDGVTDDTQAFNDAISYIASFLPSVDNPWEMSNVATYSLVIPKGNYKITGNINIPNYVNIKGESRETAILNFSDNACLYSDGYHISISDLTIMGDETSEGISINKARYKLSNINIRYCTVGLNLYEAYLGDIYAVDIQSCGVGVFIDGRGSGYGSHAMHFYGGEIHECNTGIKVKSCNGSGFYGTCVEGCDIGYDFLSNCETTNFEINNPYFEGNEIDIQGSLVSVSIINGFFSASGKTSDAYNIKADVLQEVSIMNCYFGTLPTYKTIELASGGVCTKNVFIGNNASYSDNIVSIFGGVWGTNIVIQSDGENALATALSKIVHNAPSVRNGLTLITPNDETNKGVTVKAGNDGQMTAKNNKTNNTTYLGQYVDQPQSASDNGRFGDWSTSSSYIFVYTSAGWRRAALESF